ncbi:hypothetical protein IW262DRAFT_1341143 [Armillaria fumosa]|nr:hypothetical protein IW262DRAFT_1341143 [Armillaria fumosa]
MALAYSCLLSLLHCSVQPTAVAMVGLHDVKICNSEAYSWDIPDTACSERDVMKRTLGRKMPRFAVVVQGQIFIRTASFPSPSSLPARLPPSWRRHQ